jgi:molecular chaperone DnaK (HSP70)
VLPDAGFAVQFVDKHGTDDVLQYPKVIAKMAKPVRRTKEMLSANSEAPFIVEELYKGIDFSSSITREEFENIAGALLPCICP